MLYKLLAVPLAQVARKLAPLTYGTGLSLLGALPPNPHSFLESLQFFFHIHLHALQGIKPHVALSLQFILLGLWSD